MSGHQNNNGRHTVNGTAGSDVLNGTVGDDMLLGFVGDDSLFGGAGDDILHSISGDNYFDGGLGDDAMHTTYHLGVDTFQASKTQNGDDVIFRFRFGEDKIDLGDIDQDDIDVTVLNSQKILIEWGEAGNSIMLKAPIGCIYNNDIGVIFKDWDYNPDPNGNSGTGGSGQGGTTPANGADLVLNDFWATDNSLAPGQYLELNVTAANDGNERGRGETTFYWSADDTLDDGDTLLDTESHGRLDAGETKTEDLKISADVISGLGDGFIFAVIDDEDEVTEINENNNVSDAVAVNVADGADLLITGISAPDTTLSDGEDLEITLGVGNQGSEDANGLSFYYFSADDTFGNADDVLLKSDGHGTLDAGEYDADEPVTLRYDALASHAAVNGGSGYVFAAIDALGLVDEDDEANNISDALAFDIEQSVTNGADLSIADAWLDDASLDQDQNARIRLHVQNTGDTDANGETSFYWSADDTFDAGDILIDRDGHGTVSAGELDTNERESLDYDQLASLGDGFIFAVIDDGNLVAESNEANNVSDALYIDIL